MEIKKIEDKNFRENLPMEWKEFFDEEFKEFWKIFKIYWFLDNNKLIWWFCLGYNPDYFKEKINQVLIEELNVKNYQKISYYFIVDKYKWQKKWAELLFEFINKNWWKYFLTCNWKKLKEYYISLWFKVVWEENDKFILVYEN